MSVLLRGLGSQSLIAMGLITFEMGMDPQTEAPACEGGGPVDNHTLLADLIGRNRNPSLICCALLASRGLEEHQSDSPRCGRNGGPLLEQKGHLTLSRAGNRGGW